MTVHRLSSDHVNYLIWRYLQESGYGDAAVKLQRDWGQGQDPQSLPFAQHVKTHALVRLVQKGLQYYEFEQSINQNGDHFLSKAFFGPDSRRAASPPRRELSQDENTSKPPRSPRSRKHGREASTANGYSPAQNRKRSRGNMHPVTGNEPPITNGEHQNIDGMDLDRNGIMEREAPEPIPMHSMHSPADDGQTAAETTMLDVTDDAPEPDDPRMTLTDGPSVGVQSDRVTELGPETSVLLAPQRNVLHAAWSPADPHLLAVAGDALCRIWTVTKTSDAPHDRLSPRDQFVDIMLQGDESSVTALAWSPDGQSLAVATRYEDSEQMGDIALWTKHGVSIDSLLAAQDFCTVLRWNPSGTHLLGITSSGPTSSTLMVWDVRSTQTLQPVPLDHVAVDVAWYEDRQFLICGHSLVAECTVDSPEGLSYFDRMAPDLDCIWSHVRHDAATQTSILVAEDDGVLAAMSPEGHACMTAHNAGITGISIQPVPRESSLSSVAPRRFATSSLDGNIRVWNVGNPISMVYQIKLGQANPPMAVNFTPDGYVLAAASPNRVCLWNAERGGTPKAVWRADCWSKYSGTLFDAKGQDVDGKSVMDGDSGIGDEDENAIYALSWDIDGSKLAYASNNQVAVIGMRAPLKPDWRANHMALPPS